jgi:hypothetical protein
MMEKIRGSTTAKIATMNFPLIWPSEFLNDAALAAHQPNTALNKEMDEGKGARFDSADDLF